MDGVPMPHNRASAVALRMYLVVEAAAAATFLLSTGESKLGLL